MGVVAEDDGPLARALVASLDDAESVELRDFATVASLERAVRLERVQGGVVVPAGYDAALREGRPMTVSQIVDPTTQDAAPIRGTVGAAVAGQAAVVQAARFAAGAGPFDQALAVANWGGTPSSSYRRPSSSSWGRRSSVSPGATLSAWPW